MTAADIVAQLGGRFNVNTGKGVARCPVHGDRSPSLSVKDDEDGRVLVHCFAGCAQEDVIAALREQGLWPGASPSLVVPNGTVHANGTAALKVQPEPKEHQEPKRIIGVYDYKDEAGALLFQTLRFEPKDFRQRQPNADGTWRYNLDGVRRVLYRLPELIGADMQRHVFIVEGEKDVDRLWSIGLVATTNAMGAGKWQPEYNTPLRGRHVVILPDNDAVGRQHAETIAQQLTPLAASVRVVHLDGIPEKGDVSDWLDTGGSRPDLIALVEAAPPRLSPYLSIHDMAERVATGELELIPGLIWIARRHWTFSEPGVGKTLFKLAQWMHIAAGKPFCGRPVKQGPVVVIEEDSSHWVIAEYVQTLADLYDMDLTKLPLWFNREQGVRVLDQNGLEAAWQWISNAPQKPVLVGIDACERVVPSERFHSRELDPLDRLLVRCTDAEMAVDVIDHNRKQPTQKTVSPEPTSLIDQLYGGRAKAAICDRMLYLSGSLKAGLIRAVWAKYRGETPEPFDIKFDAEEGFGLKEEPRKLTDHERTLMEVLNNTRNDGGWVSKTQLGEALKRSPRTLDRAIERMLKDQLLEQDGGPGRGGAFFRRARGAPGVFG